MMKSAVQKVADACMALLLLVSGCWLVYGSWFNFEAVGRGLDLLKKSPFYTTALGAMLILAVWLRVVSKSKRQRQVYIDFHSEDGTVAISTKAICDFINRVGREIPGVKSVDSRLIDTKGALDIALNVKVVAGHKIPELSRILQQRVRESVRESLGLEEVRKIIFRVQEIVGEPVKVAENIDTTDAF